MGCRLFAAVMGFIYLVLGVCGFVPVLDPLPVTQVDHPGIHFHLGYLFGVFPVNHLSSLMMAALGLAGLAAAAAGFARAYVRGLFLVSITLMFVGTMPYVVSTVVGLLPLYSWTSGLFMLTAIFSVYYAFVDGGAPKLLAEPILHP